MELAGIKTIGRARTVVGRAKRDNSVRVKCTALYEYNNYLSQRPFTSSFLS
jgi:hypothetical protein